MLCGWGDRQVAWAGGVSQNRLVHSDCLRLAFDAVFDHSIFVGLQLLELNGICELYACHCLNQAL